jgi:hypothetical protein
MIQSRFLSSTTNIDIFLFIVVRPHKWQESKNYYVPQKIPSRNISINYPRKIMTFKDSDTVVKRRVGRKTINPKQIIYTLHLVVTF